MDTATVDRAAAEGLRAVRELHHEIYGPNDPLPVAVTAITAGLLKTWPRWTPVKVLGVGVVCATLVVAGGAAGYQLGLRQAHGDMALLATAEGAAALRLAQSGEAGRLARCDGPGWRKENGRCYVTPHGGQVYGWAGSN